MRAWLEQDVGPKVVRFHVLCGNDFLGLDGGSAAPVTGAGVPRRQCTIVRHGEIFRLRDVGTVRRGTLVNDCYVRDTVLVPGDQIRIGGSVFRFRMLPARAAGLGIRRRDRCP